MKKILGSAALCMLSLVIFACGYTPRANRVNAVSEAAEKKDDAIVKVGNRYIYNKEIQDVFTQEMGTYSVSYSDIVENTINEIVATIEADKFSVSVSEKDVLDAMQKFKQSNKDLFEKSMKRYGKEGLKSKLSERLTFVAVKDAFLKKESPIDKKTILSFKKQKEFHGRLNEMTDEEVRKQFSEEIEDYAFAKWLRSERKKITVKYLKLYDRYKKDILISNVAKLSSKKIDGKIVKLKDKEERKRFLDLLSVVKEYQPGKVYEHLSKSKKTGDYTERACLAVCLVNKKNPDKKVDVLLADKKIDLDYRLSDRKMSRLSGVKVELSKVEQLNCDDKLLTRAVFHIGKKHCVLEGTNIEPADFVEMTGAVIMRMNDK